MTPVKTILQKYLISILLLIYTLSAFGQSIDTVFVYSDSLEKRDVRLDSKWRFSSGDSLIWASPEFDASDWDTVNSRLILNEIPNDLWNGIGWFRTTFKIDSGLRNKSIALRVTQFGASQIYLNGKMVHEFGKVSPLPDKETVYEPNGIPIPIILGDNFVYTLAIRYSNHRANVQNKWYAKWYNEAGFQSRIAELTTSIRNKVFDEAINMVVNFGIAFIFISLSFLYLILFIFYSHRKENLYYFLFTLFISLIFSSSMIPRFFPEGYTQRTLWKIVSGQSIIFVFWAYLGFLYSIFIERMPKKFWTATVVVVFVSVMFFLYIPDIVIQISVFSYIIIATLEGLRIIVIAIKKKREDAWVLGAGVIIFVGFVAFLFSVGLLGVKLGAAIMLSTFMIGLLCIPISMSVYLARHIASTNKNLVKQLKTVKELSLKEIEHQKKHVENERKTKELEEARQLQLSMLPKKLPQLPNLDIAVYMQTATEVGGDYYDFHVGLDGALTIVVGDATGHGMKAGTIVTASKSLFYTHAENPDILFIFKEMTHCLKRMDWRLLSMCMSLMKIKQNKLQLSSAGMPPILIYRQASKQVEEVLIKGMPLGAFLEFDYKLREMTINPGDVILMMSDGMPELFDDQKEMFGYERIQDIFKSSAERPVDDIINNLKTAGHDWVNGAAPQDDVTFVVIKMKN